MGKQTKHIDHKEINPKVVRKLFCDESIGNSKKK